MELAKGASVADVVRKLAISEQTYYRWKQLYGGEKADQQVKVKELERQNTSLKKMVGPAGRRRAVAYLVSLSTYSERRACRLLGQSRSTQRYEVRPVRDRDRRLRARVIELARQHPRYGYRRLTHELRRGSWKVNRKCVRRICRRRAQDHPAVEEATAARPEQGWRREASRRE